MKWLILRLDDWRWVYDVKLWGVVHGIKAFAPAMRRQGKAAHVLNTASMAAFGAIGSHTPYCSTQAAVVSISISERLYSELQFEGSVVGASCLCPGMVDTQIHRSWRNRPQQDKAWSRRESEDANRSAGSSDGHAARLPRPRKAQSDVARAARVAAQCHGQGAQVKPLHAAGG